MSVVDDDEREKNSKPTTTDDFAQILIMKGHCWANFDETNIPSACDGDSGGFEQCFESSIAWDHANSSKPSGLGDDDSDSDKNNNAKEGEEEEEEEEEATWIGRLFPARNTFCSNQPPTQQQQQQQQHQPIILTNRHDLNGGNYYGWYHDHYNQEIGDEQNYHLSNEEWILYRRRRERQLLRRHLQQQQELQEHQGIIFSHEDSSNDIVAMMDQRQRRHHVADLGDGDILLSLESSILQQQQQQQLCRNRPRQLHATAHARRERLGHWSRTIASSFYRLLSFPIRVVVMRRIIWRTRIIDHASTNSRRSQNDDDEETTRGEGNSGHGRGDHTGQEWDVSRTGWRGGQADDSDDDGDDSIASVSYWSTGTAIETISSSSLSNSRTSSSDATKMEEDVVIGTFEGNNGWDDLELFSENPPFQFCANQSAENSSNDGSPTFVSTATNNMIPPLLANP